MTKAIILIVLAVPTLILQLPPSRTDFCKGWDKGYVHGYCINDPTCLEPLPPLCPLPYLDQDKYEDGFTRGVLQGKADRKTQDSTYLKSH